MWITIRSTMFVIGKVIGAFGLGGLILWQIAVRTAPQNCVAYVHVSTPNVDVLVDDVEYHVETLWETPIVCKLRPGKHMLRMSRSGQVLDEQEFTLGIGQEIVLTAWDRSDQVQVDGAQESRLTSGAQSPRQPRRRAREQQQQPVARGP
jgi:hypothetical protein